MTTILAFSDSHCADLPSNLLQVAKEANLVFFLGDGIAHLGDVVLNKGFHAVDGNCDVQCFGTEEVIEADGVKMLITHGHKYGVKKDLLSLALRAKELGCSVAFYGHTHLARIDEYDGVTLICPGSIAYPLGTNTSYAYAVAHNGKLTVKIVNLI